MEPQLMHLKVLLPFEIFAEKEGVLRIIAETRVRLFRPAAEATGLYCGARTGNSDLRDSR